MHGLMFSSSHRRPENGLNVQAEGKDAATPPGVPVPYPDYGEGSDNESGNGDRFEFKTLGENAATSHVPSHTPEWTDHIPSDPGVTVLSGLSGTHSVTKVEHTINAERRLDVLAEADNFTFDADSLV